MVKNNKYIKIFLVVAVACLALWGIVNLNESANSDNRTLYVSEASNSSSKVNRNNAGNPEKITVPILMYHHFEPEYKGESNEIMNPENFRRQMKLLRANGYNPVTMQALIDYVYESTPLPDNPVCITFDDGYESVYTYAFPILKALDIPATCFVIGSTFGSPYYKNTTYPIIPHFGEESAKEMTASGLMDIQSHTFDWHHWAPYEDPRSVIREDLLMHEDETVGKYSVALTEDCRLFNRLMAKLGLDDATAFAYPRGKVEQNAAVVLKNEGIKLTVTTNPQKKNVIIKGSRQSLFELGRMYMTDKVSDESLLAYLETGTA